MTFLLWADQYGYLSTLERASLGDNLSTVEIDATDVEFYSAPKGDLDALEPPPPSWCKS